MGKAVWRKALLGRRRGFVVVNFLLPLLDGLDHVVRVLAVDGAANRLCRTEDLEHGASHLPGHGLGAHVLGDRVDVVVRDVAVVEDCRRRRRERNTP